MKLPVKYVPYGERLRTTKELRAAACLAQRNEVVLEASRHREPDR